MSSPEPTRVAVSQRVIENEAYPERRDALAQGWAVCFERWNLLPVLVPNRWRDPADFIRRWDVAAVLLTGGNDLTAAAPDGVEAAPERDRTEHALLSAAQADALPVLGVCRGAQMMNLHLGGRVSPTPGHGEAPHRHRVDLDPTLGLDSMTVNSFHRWAVEPGDLARSLVAFASAPDGSVEGFAHPALPWVGMMWHPEREEPGAPLILDRIGRFLRGEATFSGGQEAVLG